MEHDGYATRIFWNPQMLSDIHRLFPTTLNEELADYLGISQRTLVRSVPLLRYLIELFTDKGDVVIDPCAGSGSTLLASAQCGGRAYGFEIKKDFCKLAREKVLANIQPKLF